MRSNLFNDQTAVEPAPGGGMSVQNLHCIRYVVNGSVLARQGAMVAYRGNLQIQTKSQGMGNMLKRAVTGEGVALMEVTGQGEMWFAEKARSVFTIALEQGDGLSVNGKSVLVFDPSLSYNIALVRGAGMVGGGLFNCVFTGTGQLAITAEGMPMVIPVTPDNPVYVDTDAVVAWSANLQTGIRRSEGMRSLIRGGSGELAQLSLVGHGFVVVQPSEGIVIPQQGGGGGGGALGGLLNG